MISDGSFLLLSFSIKDKDSSELLSESKSVLYIKGYSKFLPKKVEEELVKSDSNEIEVYLNKEDGFGERDPELIKTFPISAFDIRGSLGKGDYVALEIEGKSVLGKVIYIGSGRLMIDLNNPLAGRNLIYKIKIEKNITDENEKIKALEDHFNVKIEKKEDNSLKIEGNENEKKEVSEIIKKYINNNINLLL
ncbi:MAG: hypothetical protein QXX36_00825 [Candidatus Rehaiarchaeum fermentans]|nr:hypothetical protein [Candidatus Rehaiarchaeum fermentans]MCW1297550.1 hypothetical protein [Candidatus Rehaiarchaeum fermentans]MCW1302162.1 hypothetical protein [Candidatus Rehaiarchaeum fermentans]